MSVAVVLVFAVIALWKTPKLVKEKRWSTLAVFCSVLAIACVFCLLLVAQVRIDSPRKAVEDVINALKHP